VEIDRAPVRLEWHGRLATIPGSWSTIGAKRLDLEWLGEDRAKDPTKVAFGTIIEHFAGRQQDGKRRISSLQPASEAFAVKSRHRQIGNNHAGARRVAKNERLRRGMRREAVVTGRLDDLSKCRQTRLMVVDEQDQPAGAGTRRRSHFGRVGDV
jgi:hypothetical protein